MSKVGILWLRQDLRLADNPALAQACKDFETLACVFIDDPMDQTCSRIGAASRAWLHRSLHSLYESLGRKGCQLFFMQGEALGCLRALQVRVDATAVYWNRVYDPASIDRDKKIKLALLKDFAGDKDAVQSFNALLLAEPWENCKDDTSAYRVFTPYWRRLAPTLPGPQPLQAPRKIPPSPDAEKVSSIVCTLESLRLEPALGWSEPMLSHWEVGESAASKKLSRYLRRAVGEYSEARNLPDRPGTSRLSPHLHFGEISPRQIIHALYKTCPEVTHQNSSAQTYAKEIVWREFAYHLIFHFPDTIDMPLDNRFLHFPWQEDYSKVLAAWQKGQTGVPIVDAGMRELWQTGWMHNRVRMIVASYLIKNLLIPWQEGERWFRDTLVDADLASNAMGWQWTAGSGADAAPYFRVFNPVLQGEKFDADGAYVKKWVPELAGLAKKEVHKPWELPVLLRAQIDYPEPLIDLKESRVRALAAFETVKASRK